MTKDTSPQLSMIIFSHLLLHPHLRKVFVCGGEGGSGRLILFRIGKVISGFFDPAGFTPEI